MPFEKLRHLSHIATIKLCETETTYCSIYLYNKCSAINGIQLCPRECTDS